MASASAKSIQKVIQNSAIVKRGAEYARQEIFGNLPQLNMPTGNKNAKKSFTGPYLEKYYPASINEIARKVSIGTVKFGITMYSFRETSRNT